MTVVPDRAPGPYVSLDAEVLTPWQSRSRSRLLGFLCVPVIALLALAPAAVGRSPLLGFAGMALAVALVLLARNPVWIGLCVVALVPITSGLARGLVVPGLRVSEALIVLGAMCLLGLPTQLRRRWTGLDLTVLGYVALATLLPLADLFLVSGRPLDDVAIQTLFGPVQFGLLYFVASTCFRTERASVSALRALLLCSLPVAAIGILEALGPPAVHDSLIRLSGTTAFNTVGYASVTRAASVFPVWLALAGYLLVVLTLASSLLIRGDTAVLPRWCLLVVVASGVLALVATLTITIAVTYALVSVYLGWRHHRLKLVVAVLALAAAAAQLLFGTLLAQRATAQSVAAYTSRTGPSWLPQTLGYRVAVWQDQYLPALLRYGSSGYGPGFPPEVDWSHTESGYITLLLRGGVPYVAVTVVLLAAIVRTARQQTWAAATPARAALCETAALVAVLQIPINLTFPYFTASGLPQPAWIVWGLLAARTGALAHARTRPLPKVVS